MRHDDPTRAMLAEAIATELRDKSALLPPWRKHPNIPRYSIGWRMGYGDHYLMVWWQWAAEQSKEALLDSFRAHAPIPVEWADWAAGQLGFDEDGEDPESGVARLAELGLVDLDAWSRYWKSA